METDDASFRRAFNIPNRPLREASDDDQSRRDFSSPRDAIGACVADEGETRRARDARERARKRRTKIRM